MSLHSGRKIVTTILVWLAHAPVLSLAVDGPPNEGLILWLDANDVDGDGNAANQPRNRDSLKRWADKSGRGNHVLQNEDERQPTFQTRELGQRPVVRFHADDVLELTGLNGLSSGDQRFHLLFVMKAPSNSTHAAQRIIDLNSSAAGSRKQGKRNGFWVGFQRGRRKVRFGIHGGDEAEGMHVAWNDKPNIIETVYTGEQNFVIHLNGKLEQRGMFNGTYFLGFQQQLTFALGQHYGVRSNQDTYYQGDIAEVLFYDRPLTATERFETGTYLTNKYSLTTEFRPIPQFETQVYPILARHCHDCHGRQPREAELDLRSVAGMLRGGKAGPVLVRGFPERSEMIAMLETHRMPPQGATRLTDAEIRQIREWIAADSPSKEKVVAEPVTPKITDEQRRYWTYQKLRRQPPPQVRQKNRVSNVIDQFILARLEQMGLSFSQPASRTTLIRRAFFDLVGLPPSHAQVDTFVNDDQPDAYVRLIDGLLNSPHFGERWGRHWLDVSGYVDVYGSDNDAAIIKSLKGKWRYRDYVIRSFNQDKSFDRFIVEQLAGDELFDWRSADQFTPEMLDALIATSFLLSANDDTSANELNTPDKRHHVLQRTTEVVANSLLSLTLQCAKCHDHKYEAIPQIDYYRLESVFAPAFNVRHWVVATDRGRADVPDSQKARIDGLNSEIDKKVAVLNKRESAIRSRYRQTLFNQRLAKLPESIRAVAAAAVQTQADKRNSAQKQLAKQYETSLTIKDEEITLALSQQHRTQIAEISSEINSLNGKRQRYDTIQVVCESNAPTPTHVLRRGNYLRPGLQVHPGLLSILDESRIGEQVSRFRSADAKAAGRSSGRRLALANQLTDPQTLAGQYVARVIVNRLWQQVFGKGIVATSDNFGESGSRPTHPKMLDWLTQEFLRQGWRVKPIVRMMMLSNTYCQTSAMNTLVPHNAVGGPVRAEQIDPANKLLWRMNLRRLDSECIRDSILATSGKLERTLFGAFVPLHVRPDGMVVIKEDGLSTPTSKWRRSVYVLARRNYHLTMLRVFGQPIVATNCTVRRPSAVVTQALTLLHDDFVLQQADYFAERVAGQAKSDSAEDQVVVGYRIALGRAPSTEELSWCSALLESQRAYYTTDNLSQSAVLRKALSEFCKVLFNTNEFLYVE